MNETIDCIFGNATASELAARVMKKTLKAQKSINRKYGFYAILSAFAVYQLYRAVNRQSEKIKKLTAEIEGLKGE
jgi:hypothetical protein